jgi:acetyltransferase-like isoleucine patch superfamily enzyme
VVAFSAELKQRLFEAGIETLFAPGQIVYPETLRFEPPCSLKWLRIEYDVEIGAFSYAVSGYAAAVTMGRYVSIGEEVNLGRQDHPVAWMSTSPFQYLTMPLFSIGTHFTDADQYHRYLSHFVGMKGGTAVKRTLIGNDVWIGHGAMVRAGVTIGDGAIVGAGSVVVKNVPPYAIVGGNPAQVLRMRLPEKTAERIAATRWWRFAPWQLGKIAFDDGERAAGQLEEIVGTLSPYEPGIRRISEFLDVQLQ